LFRRDVLIYGVQIITEAVIARTLGPIAMGVWAILRLVPAYAEVFGRSQVDTAAIYVLGTRRHSVGAVAFAIIVISVASAVFVTAVFLLAEPWLFATFLRQASSARPAVTAILAYIPFRFLAICYNKLLLYDEDVRGYNTANVLLTLLPAVLGAVLVTAFHEGVTGLAVALIFGGAAAVAYSAVRVHARHPLVVHGDRDVVRELMAFGFKLYLGTMVQFLYVYGSTALIVLYLPVAQVAFFRMAQDRALLLSRVPASVASLLYPRVARLGDSGDARSLVVSSVRVTLLILLGAGAVAVLIARPAVMVLYGPAFDGVVLPLVFLIPGIVVDASSSLLMQYYLGVGRLWIVVGLTTVGVAIQVGLLVAGLARWGIVGGAAAISAAYLVIACVRVAVFSATEGVSPAQFRLTKADVAFVVRFIGRQLARAGLRRAAGGNITATTED
jgi:O-antigen/teichoic acid export membrane protein